LGRESLRHYVRPRRRALNVIVFLWATWFDALRFSADSTMSIGSRNWPREPRTDFMRSTPVKEPTQDDQSELCCGAWPTTGSFPLLIESKLSTQEEILGDERPLRATRDTDHLDQKDEAG
jgi:hypothetical protein